MFTLSKHFASSLLLSSTALFNLSALTEDLQPTCIPESVKCAEPSLEKTPHATNCLPTCGVCIQPSRITMRHIEANGVGYNQGYTTLEGFFAPLEPWKCSWFPFLDLRAHIFNDGKPALNTGIGFRYLSASRIWGVNAYYDYRKTNHQHYNQIAAGFESLGEVWDFRLNGYLPVGSTKSSFLTEATFSKFQGNHAYIKRKREFAMKGVNGEVGAHINPFNDYPVYVAAGPYYLEGLGTVAWGGEARVAMDIFDYVRIEGNASYDNVFKWIGQGQLSLIIPFGGKREVKQRDGHCCSQEIALAMRSVQRVDRNEIIPVDKKNKTTLATDPATGLPYVFWFVDNTSHSAGTFESPFPTLAEALNVASTHDVIYVFPGDGTSTGMNGVIILKDGQKLFGAGINQNLATTLGTITIPGQANGMPFIVSSFPNTILCANDNEISGLHLQNQDIAVGANSIICSENNLSVHHNTITVNNEGNGIEIHGITGLANISYNNFILDNSNGPFGIFIINNPHSPSYLITNNQFTAPATTTSAGISIQSLSSNGGNFEFSKNTFSGCGNAVMSSLDSFTFTSNVIFDQNVIINCGNPTSSCVGFDIKTTGNLSAQITNNVWQNNAAGSLRSLSVVASDSTNACVILANNTSDNGKALQLDNAGTGTFTANAAFNTPAYTAVGTVTPGTCP